MDETQGRLDELVEEQSAEDGALADCLNDKDAVDAKEAAAKLKRLKWRDAGGEETRILDEYARLSNGVKDQGKRVKELEAALEAKVRAKYPGLDEEAIKDLLVGEKWGAAVFAGIRALYVSASHSLANPMSSTLGEFSILREF